MINDASVKEFKQRVIGIMRIRVGGGGFEVGCFEGLGEIEDGHLTAYNVSGVAVLESSRNQIHIIINPNIGYLRIPKIYPLKLATLM